MGVCDSDESSQLHYNGRKRIQQVMFKKHVGMLDARNLTQAWCANKLGTKRRENATKSRCEVHL